MNVWGQLQNGLTHFLSISNQAGLGYHIKAENTHDQLGRIPLRRLVYRVREIPSSLFPFIWDFGTLDEDAEKKYIAQMVQKSVVGEGYQQQCGLIVEVLHQSQVYMRSRNDECSFVSLRDVERGLKGNFVLRAGHVQLMISPMQCGLSIMY